jgi:glycosyltransferase involved in cell wall biosynthesis
MKVAIVSVQVPFIVGGAELLAEALRDELRAAGHQPAIVTIPFKWYPPERVLDSLLLSQMIDVTEVNGEPIDRVIALKFPAYFVSHPRKVGWILHQHRQAYELYGTPYGDLHQTDSGRRAAEEIRRWDSNLLPSLQPLFTISRNVTDRLRRNNGIESEVLYPPPLNAERFTCRATEKFVLYPGRFDPMKRQHLIVKAMQHLPKDVSLVLIGNDRTPMRSELVTEIERLGLGERIRILGMVSEEEKLQLYSDCLAVYNGVYDEDYGYLSIEGMLASKPVLTHTDSGGAKELVEEGVSGWICPPEPEAIAEKLRPYCDNPRRAEELGRTARRHVDGMGISWKRVIERLLA